MSKYSRRVKKPRSARAHTRKHHQMKHKYTVRKQKRARKQSRRRVRSLTRRQPRNFNPPIVVSTGTNEAPESISAPWSDNSLLPETPDIMDSTDVASTTNTNDGIIFDDNDNDNSMHTSDLNGSLHLSDLNVTPVASSAGTTVEESDL